MFAIAVGASWRFGADVFEVRSFSFSSYFLYHSVSPDLHYSSHPSLEATVLCSEVGF